MNPGRCRRLTQRFTESGSARATISDGTFKLNYLNGDWELFYVAKRPGGEPEHGLPGDGDQSPAENGRDSSATLVSRP